MKYFDDPSVEDKTTDRSINSNETSSLLEVMKSLNFDSDDDAHDNWNRSSLTKLPYSPSSRMSHRLGFEESNDSISPLFFDCEKMKKTQHQGDTEGAHRMSGWNVHENFVVSPGKSKIHEEDQMKSLTSNDHKDVLLELIQCHKSLIKTLSRSRKCSIRRSHRFIGPKPLMSDPNHTPKRVDSLVSSSLHTSSIPFSTEILTSSSSQVPPNKKDSQPVKEPEHLFRVSEHTIDREATHSEINENIRRMSQNKSPMETILERLSQLSSEKLLQVRDFVAGL